MERHVDNGGLNAASLAISGWASRLTAFVVAFLAVESLTGLWIYLAPFSVSSQVQVLVHTAAGLLLLIPLAWYLIAHFLAWYRQKLSAVMALGYALALLTVAPW